MLSYALFFYNIKITSVKGEIPIHTCMVLQTKAEQPLSRSSKATLPLMQDRQGAGQSSTQSIRPSLRTYLLQVSQHLFAGDKHHIQHRVRARVSFHKCVLSAHCPQPRLTMSQCDLGGVRQNRNTPTRSDGSVDAIGVSHSAIRQWCPALAIRTSISTRSRIRSEISVILHHHHHHHHRRHFHQ